MRNRARKRILYEDLTPYILRGLIFLKKFYFFIDNTTRTAYYDCRNTETHLKGRLNMAKLSKAQAEELELIRTKYSEKVAESIAYYREKLADPTTEEKHREFFERRLKESEDGFILWRSSNSRTLQKLADMGFIDYVKNDKYGRFTPLDLVRIRKEDEA